MSEPVFVGLDVGSSATKCVLLDGGGELVGHHVVASGFDYAESADSALAHSLLQASASRDDIASCVSTGYGRASISIADRQVTEISCHARGAREW